MAPSTVDVVRGTSAEARVLRPRGVLSRPRLENRLAEAMTRRLTCVVAGAGFGKTTLVASWAEAVEAAWYTATPEDVDWLAFGRGVATALARRVPAFTSTVLAGLDSAGPEAAAEEEMRPEAWSAMACEALDGLDRDLALVIDDAHELGAGPSARLLEGLCRQAPSRLHVVVASRSDLPFPLDRLRGRGQLLELGGRELAFREPEVADLLAVWLDPDAAELAGALCEATGGWPAAVRLGAEALWARPPAKRREALDALYAREGPVFGYLAAEALAVEPTEVTDLVRAAARFDRFTAATCEAVGIPRAAATIASLLRRGLFLEPHAREGWLTLYPLVRDYALECLPMDASEERDLHRRAARWFEDRGFAEEALREFAAGDDDEALAAALIRHGPELLTAARVDTVLRAAHRLPRRGPELEVVVGQARQMSGDWEGALACYLRASEADRALGSGLAWRMGLIHYLRGDVDEAQATYERARLDGRQPADDVLVLAWLASIHFLRGERDACEDHARRALALAVETGDERGLAAAHTVLAMLAALVGERATTRAHDQLALDHATRAGDVLQLIRIRSNRGAHAMEEGCYREALVEFEAGLRLAEVSGFAALRAHIIANRGETRLHLGDLDEAAADLDEARLIYERMGSRKLCLPLTVLGDVHREAGKPIAARACYEEALAILERSPDHQLLVPALVGVARLITDEDADEAGRLVKRALAAGPGPGRVAALLAAGHVALASGDAREAAHIAVEAAIAARAHRNHVALAEAFELEGAAGGPLAVARLEAAVQLWTDLDNPVGKARAQLALAGMVGGTQGQALAVEARSCLTTVGARRYERVADELVATLDQATVPPIAVQTLGGFRVFRAGTAVGSTEWQSRKARDLLKILIARRGRPVAREVLMDLLWPDEDPVAVSNRLSGALATVRTVLDPGRRFPNDHFVAGDKESLWLDRSTVRVDVERFLAEAAAGLAPRGQSTTGEAEVDLAAAEAAYGGEFLEEDPYEEWAVPLRDEARAAYLALARRLALDASERGDDEAATRYYLRILARDPYDEPAHRGLVATHTRAGRHGEAARSRRAYRDRMRELGLEPSAPGPEHRVGRNGLPATLIPASGHPHGPVHDGGAGGRQATALSTMTKERT